MTNIQIGLLVGAIIIVAILLFAEHIFHGNVAEMIKRKPKPKVKK